MTAQGVVSGIHSDGSVDVEVTTGAARCAGCAGACLWRRLPATTRARLPARIALTVGMPVLVVLPQRYVLLSALLLHGLPWAAMLAGAAAGAFVTRTDLGCLLGAVLAGAFSIMMTPRLRRRLERAAMARFDLQPI
jgi:positive regulator of sigma E activity